MRKSTIAIALSTVYSSTAWCADMDLFDLSLRELMDTPVQGSTLTQETVSSAPTAVTVFDQAFIASVPVNYLYELLNYVPGIQSQRGADSSFAYGYSFRGRRNGNQSKEALLLIDGQVINDPRTGAANGSLRLITVDRISRVEVIRGPGSAIYGSGAYGGVINVVTRKDWNETAIGGGNLGLARVRTMGTVSAENWSADAYLNASRDDGDEYSLDDTFSDAASDRITTRDPRRMVDLSGSLNLGDTRVSLIWSEVEGGDYYSLETISEDYNFNRYIHRGIHASHQMQWSEKNQLDINFQHIFVEQHLDSQITAEGAVSAISNPSSDDPIIIKALVKAEGYRFSLHNDWQYSRDFSAQMGMNWQRNVTLTSEAANNYNTEQLTNNDFPIDYYGDFSQTVRSQRQDPQQIWGVYGQGLIIVGEHHQFNVGMRYDSNENVDSHISPRLGWVYNMNDEHTFKLLYGEAFRAASLSEMSNPNSPVLRGNLELDHEIIKTVDAIFLHQEDDLNYQFGLYYNHYQSPIGIILNSEDIRQYINGPSDDGYGVELEFNWSIASGYWLRGSFSEMLEMPSAFFREGERTGSLHFTYSNGPWLWSLSGVYQSETITEISEGVFQQLPSHWVWGSKLSVTISPSIRTVFQIKNVSDEQYVNSPQGQGLPEGVPNRGREISCELEYQW